MSDKLTANYKATITAAESGTSKQFWKSAYFEAVENVYWAIDGARNLHQSAGGAGRVKSDTGWRPVPAYNQR